MAKTYHKPTVTRLGNIYQETAMTSDNPIDRFFDRAEELLDGTIPTGRLGFAYVPTRSDDKPMAVWHMALYKLNLVCDDNVRPRNEHFRETPPKGGYLPFCRKCLVMMHEQLKE